MDTPSDGVVSPITLRTLFPDGGSLPEEIWQKRYSFLLGLTWLHAAVIVVVGPLLGYSWEISLGALVRDGTVLHTAFEGSVVAFFAALGTIRRLGRSFQAVAVAV